MPPRLDALPGLKDLPDRHSFTADIDGDGVMELLVRPKTKRCTHHGQCGGLACVQREGRGWCERATSVWDSGSVVEVDLGLETTDTPYVIDINNDGMSDLLLRTTFAPGGTVWPDPSGTCADCGAVGIAVATGEREAPFEVMSSGLANTGGLLWVGDFNGDSADDIVRVLGQNQELVPPYGFHAALNTGAWLGPEQSTGVEARFPRDLTDSFPVFSRGWVFDADADGADELLHLTVGNQGTTGPRARCRS